MDSLKYPIGQFVPQPYSEQLHTQWLTHIKNLPQHLENAVLNLDSAQLNTPYRPDGWMVKQVIHHVADSHMNAYIRLKLGLTEDNPTIKPYNEVQWAEMKDTHELPINISLTLLHALHTRFYHVFKNVSTAHLQQKTIYHPASKKQFTLWDLLGMYSWHGRHHTAHITTLREQMKW